MATTVIRHYHLRQSVFCDWLEWVSCNWFIGMEFSCFLLHSASEVYQHQNEQLAYYEYLLATFDNIVLD